MICPLNTRKTRKVGIRNLCISRISRAILLLLTSSAFADEVPSFRNDVMPVFLRAGCNTGGCHGSARGQDGFGLSLFGFDPAGDYQRITREMSGRRINLAVPEESLLLQKATGSVPHTGGERFKKDSELYATILKWIKAGAPDDAKDVAQPVALELSPRELLLAGAGAKQRLRATARYSDGKERDVTNLAVFQTNNEPVAAVSADGEIIAGERGEALVTARFASFTVGAQTIVVSQDSEFSFPETSGGNYIDGHIEAKLRKLQVAPSEVCSDAVFARRVYLDIIGLLPAREELENFVASEEPDKRAKLIDALLARPEFADQWVMKWAELLQIRSSNEVSYKAALRYFEWLREKLLAGVPFDQITREILTATGGTLESPAANYYQVTTDPLVLAENAAQVFAGVRMQCAQCHNHPFDRWTTDDYYGFTAFFTQVGRKKGEDPRETIVFDKREGEAKHILGEKPVAPKFLGGAEPEVKGRDRRAVLADWLTSAENPWFAKNLANITWEHFFGRGIVEPVDDVRVSNPAANPELLDALGGKLVEYGYDFRRLVRDICNSRTYQRATQTNESNKADERNFSHAGIRRIRAEVLLDCITGITETQDKFRGLPLGARAVEIADGKTSNYFLTTFGRARRETVCSCEVLVEPNLSQALHLLNGDTVAKKVRQSLVIKRMLEEMRPPREIVEELYVRSVSRKPTEAEIGKVGELLEGEEKPKAVLEDVFWALLNSKEFLFNH